MKCLALSCGTGVYRDSDIVYVVHVGGNGLSVARFVVLLFACLAGVTGVALAATVSLIGGSIAFGLATLSAWLFVTLGTMRTRLGTRPPQSMPCYVTLRLKAQEVRDHQGELLGPLAAAQLELVFQATSSAKALALVLAGNRLIIARGNPFAGDVDVIIQALADFGIQPPT